MRGDGDGRDNSGPRELEGPPGRDHHGRGETEPGLGGGKPRGGQAGGR